MRICITRTEKGRYSETFIDNQIAMLSKHAEVFVVHDGRLPQRDNINKRLSPFPFWVLHNITRTLTGRRNNYFGNYGLLRFLKKNKIDVVLANYGIAGVHVLPICKQAGIPLVVHFHGFDASQKAVLKAYQEAYRVMFREAAAIIAVSTDMKQQLMTLGTSEEKIGLIPYGIDIKKFTPDYVKKQQNLFLAAGRFTEKKSPQSTIRAFAEVHRKGPAKLIMAGERSGLFEVCHRLAGELDVEKDIIFTGIQSPAEVAKLMQDANVFIQHSVTAVNGDKEGTPNTILEAAASGLPIVSTRHAGIKEAVVENITGFLVDEHDIVGMTLHMKRLLDEPELAIRMGKAGRRHIEENYDLEKQSAKLFSLLCEIAGKQC